MSTQLAIVVPCYNEQEVLPETSRRLLGLLERLVGEGLVSASSRIYFVDDGSRDRTWSVIEKLSRARQQVCGIKLSRNRGHQNALIAGLFTAEGDAIVSIDADLQDDVEVIRDMVQQQREGAEIVYGVRSDRAVDGLLRYPAKLHYRLLRLMGAEVVLDHADFRLMSRRAIEALREYREVNLYVRGIVPMLGFKTATVAYKRAERFAGESKYSLRKLAALAFQGITSFSAAPLRFITALGLIVCAGSFVLVVWALWRQLFTNQLVPGWASTVVPIYFLGGVQLLCIGVIGEYLAKIYLEVKGRPRFVIEQAIGGDLPQLGDTGPMAAGDVSDLTRATDSSREHAERARKGLAA